jgi:hypothetical protein
MQLWEKNPLLGEGLLYNHARTVEVTKWKNYIR